MQKAPVVLTPAARADLADIARYTAKTWGKTQAMKYADEMDKAFRAIAAVTDRSCPALPDTPTVRVCRCQHHYVFYWQPEHDAPVILAVLHERMDMMERLHSRLPL